MFDQLDIVEERYEQLNEMLSDLRLLMIQISYVNIQKNKLLKTVDVYRDYKSKRRNC